MFLHWLRNSGPVKRTGIMKEALYSKKVTESTCAEGDWGSVYMECVTLCIRNMNNEKKTYRMDWGSGNVDLGVDKWLHK